MPTGDNDWRNPSGLPSRREVVTQLGLLALALTSLPSVLKQAGFLDDALAATPDVVSETFNGVVAFVVPGSDAYSVVQGQSTPEPGGIDAGATPALIAGLNLRSGSTRRRPRASQRCLMELLWS
jgi:hypothetical protein